MRIRVKYLGLIAEITGCGEEFFSSDAANVRDFTEILFTKYANLKKKNFTVAQNQIIVSGDAKLTGKEIALLPPFSGG